MYLREMGSVELSVARRRDRHRQAHRGRPRDDDRGPVRKPADLPGDHHLARRAQRDPRSCCARSSISKPPMPGRRPSRRRWSSAPKSRTRPSRPTTKPRRPREDDDITNVGGEGRGRGGRGGRGRGQPVAGGHGSRAAAAGDGDPRRHRRHLQEAAQAAGPAGREPAGGRRHAVAQPGPPAEGAQGPADQGGEVAVAQPERASRRWSSSSTTSTSGWCRTKAGCCGWPKAMACAARSSSRNTRAPSSTRTG